MHQESIHYPFSPLYYESPVPSPRAPSQPPSASSSSTVFSYTISEDSLVVPGKWFLDNVTVNASKVLGRGSFGTVCLGEWLGCPVAIKKPHEVFFEKSVSETERGAILKTFAREINLMFQLKHPNIVLFYGLHDTSGSRPSDPRGESLLSSETCLVQELLQCSLSTRNRQTPRLTYRNTIDLSLGITGGLRYLHERTDPIVHRDLASKNILLNQNGVPKIADLGVAKVINTSRKFIHLSRQPGTELYMPPEVKIEGMQYDSHIDIYSLGVIVLEMSVGRDPTAGEAFRTTGNEGAELRLVPEVERRRRDLLDLGDSPLKGLILRCLAHKDERVSAIDVFTQLEQLKTQRHYSNQLETPVMPLSLDHWPSSPPRSSTGPTSSSHHERYKIMEEKVKLLEEENEQLLMKLSSEKREGGSLPNKLDDFLSTYPNNGRKTTSSIEINRISERPVWCEQYNRSEQNQLRLLEATVRSRDSEITSLRERNISLEQEIAGFQNLYSNNGFRSDKRSPQLLLARGVPSSPPPYANGSSGHVTSNGSLRDVESELKQVKRNLEKYKNLTIELDSKLKDAKLELTKHETRQTGSHVQARYENEALRSENLALRSEIDRLRRECNQLQSQKLYHHRY